MLANTLFSSIFKIDTDVQSIFLGLRLPITPTHLTHNLCRNISSFSTHGNDKEVNFTSNDNAKLRIFSSPTKPQTFKPCISGSIFYIMKPLTSQTLEIPGYLRLLHRLSILVQLHARLVELPEALNIIKLFQV